MRGGQNNKGDDIVKIPIAGHDLPASAPPRYVIHPCLGKIDKKIYFCKMQYFSNKTELLF